MHELAGWEKINVEQKDHDYGCVPAGLEWMIQFAKVEGVKLECFQENCLLDAIKARNGFYFDFKTIAEVIIKRNPHLDIKLYINGNEHVDTNVKRVDPAKKDQYSSLKIHIKNVFSNGSEKYSFIETLIKDQIPCVLSTFRKCNRSDSKCEDFRIDSNQRNQKSEIINSIISNSTFKIGVHVRPVIKIDNQKLFLREYNEQKPVLYEKWEIEDYHDLVFKNNTAQIAARDIAWLEVV